MDTEYLIKKAFLADLCPMQCLLSPFAHHLRECAAKLLSVNICNVAAVWRNSHAIYRMIYLKLFHRFEVAWHPAFFEPWFKRAVEAEYRVVSLAGHCLHPITFLSFRCLGAEVNGCRPIIIQFHAF